MTATEGDDRTESSLYDDFHVTCLRWAIETLTKESKARCFRISD